MSRDQAELTAHRISAALAEVGYGPVTEDGSEAVRVCYHANRVDGPWGVRVSLLIPAEFAWRAGQVAGCDPSCLACYVRYHDVRIRQRVGCLDSSGTQLDCGLNRDAAVPA